MFPFFLVRLTSDNNGCVFPLLVIMLQARQRTGPSTCCTTWRPRRRSACRRSRTQPCPTTTWACWRCAGYHSQVRYFAAAAAVADCVVIVVIVWPYLAVGLCYFVWTSDRWEGDILTDVLEGHVSIQWFCNLCFLSCVSYSSITYCWYFTIIFLLPNSPLPPTHWWWTGPDEADEGLPPRDVDSEEDLIGTCCFCTVLCFCCCCTCLVDRQQLLPSAEKLCRGQIDFSMHHLISG